MKVKVCETKNGNTQLRITLQSDDDVRALYLRANLDDQNIAAHYAPKGKGHICPEGHAGRTTALFQALREIADENGIALRRR